MENDCYSKDVIVLILFVLFISCLGQEFPNIPTLPDFGEVVNKTEHELMMEDCMEDYIQCLAVNRKKSLCAENASGKHRLFYSLCEMEYENCRDLEEKWHYLQDDVCRVEKGFKNGTAS